jgi:hypothetical protein
VQAKQEVSFTVDDAKGSPAFMIKLTPFCLTPGGLEARRIDLYSVCGEVVFAHCCVGDADAGTVTIYQGAAKQAGTRFAEVRQDMGMEDGTGYTATVCANGYQVILRGDWRRGSMNANDSDGRLLAISEPVQDKRSIRVGPLVDVGFIVLTILGMDLLMAQRGSQSRR